MPETYTIKNPEVRPIYTEPMVVCKDCFSIFSALTYYTRNTSHNTLTYGNKIKKTVYSDNEQYRIIGIMTCPWSLCEKIRSMFFRIVWPFLSPFNYINAHTLIPFYTKKQKMTLLVVPIPNTPPTTRNLERQRQKQWNNTFSRQLSESNDADQMAEVINNAIKAASLYSEVFDIIEKKSPHVKQLFFYNLKLLYPGWSGWSNLQKNRCCT